MADKPVVIDASPVVEIADGKDLARVFRALADACEENGPGGLDIHVHLPDEAPHRTDGRTWIELRVVGRMAVDFAKFRKAALDG